MKMRKVKNTYNIINGIVLLIAIFIFFQEYCGDIHLQKERDVLSFTILIAAVVFAHMIKAGRLYLALYGADIGWETYLKVYCKVTPVSMIFPLKVGEFFKMYCYGKELKNGLKGIIIVLLDRFMDTLALISMVLAVWFVNGGRLSFVIYVLMLIVVCLLILYYVFPSIYSFWNHFLLSAKATEKKIALLHFLDVLHTVYGEISGVTRGRGILLYALSVIAWGIELGSVVLISGDRGIRDKNRVISQYLSSALGIGYSIELRQFVFCSVVLLIITYSVIKFFEQKKQVRSR